jgi:hypothetical protein
MGRSPKARLSSLIPNGIPKYVRIYDNKGKTADRFTVVFTGNYPTKYYYKSMYIGMSEQPTHPQGVYCRDFANDAIDRPSYGRLGKKINFNDLPPICQETVIEDYKTLWQIEEIK